RRSAAERLDRDDPAVLHELFGRPPADGLFQAGGAEQLDRALVGERGARMYRRTAVILYGQGTDAVLRQKQRSRHSHQAASTDQDRNFDFAHNYLAAWRPGACLPPGPRLL